MEEEGMGAGEWMRIKGEVSLHVYFVCKASHRANANKRNRFTLLFFSLFFGEKFLHNMHA